MSVIMALYKVRDDVDYVGSYADHVTKKDFEDDEQGICNLERIEAAMGAPMKDGHWPGHSDGEIYDQYNAWRKQREKEVWSDKQEHYFFSWSYYQAINSKERGYRRLRNRIKKLKVKTYKPRGEQYLCLDPVLYSQGWFFKKRFFKKKIFQNISATKEEMLNFLKQYCTDADEIERFSSLWEPGMVFVCSW